MGVTRDSREVFIYGYSEDEFEFLQQSTEEEETLELTGSARRGPHRNRSKNKNMQCLEIQPNLKKRCGARQARRTENLRQLMTLAEKDELGEIEIENVFEPNVSAFARLLMEPEKMKIWNDFVNQSEEEQQHFLQSRRHPKPQMQHAEKCCTDEDGSDLDDSWEEIPDKRAAHPAYTPEKCFQRIEKSFRMSLKRRHFPVGMLINLENEIVSFFCDWPNSVYVTEHTDSYKRMMLHALCQYLDLHSQSYGKNEERRTQIENKNTYFAPPSQLLSDYIQQRRS